MIENDDILHLGLEDTEIVIQHNRDCAEYFELVTSSEFSVSTSSTTIEEVVKEREKNIKIKNNLEKSFEITVKGRMTLDKVMFNFFNMKAIEELKFHSIMNVLVLGQPKSGKSTFIKVIDTLFDSTTEPPLQHPLIIAELNTELNTKSENKQCYKQMNDKCSYFAIITVSASQLFEVDYNPGYFKSFFYPITHRFSKELEWVFSYKKDIDNTLGTRHARILVTHMDKTKITIDNVKRMFISKNVSDSDIYFAANSVKEDKIQFKQLLLDLQALIL